MAKIENLKLQNLNCQCRTCLGVLKDQGHKLSLMTTTKMLSILRQIGLKMPQTEHFPNALCDECYDTIKAFHDFEIKVEKSTAYLEKMLLETTENDALALAEMIKLDVDDNHELDPLNASADVESVLVKMEFEIVPNLNEPVKGKLNDGVQNSVAENDIDVGSVQEITEIQLNDTKTLEKTTKIVCKFGCGRTFRHKHKETAHYRFKHKLLEEAIELKQPQEEERLFIEEMQTKSCTICFKNFGSLNSLRSHMATHGNVRPFQCDQCDRGFNMKARLNRHIREVHEANPPEISCKYGCGRVFTRHESAMNHYRIKHILPEKGIEPKKNTYVCEDCGKTFKTLHNLKEHSYVHRPITERPFQCEQCQKRFVSKRPYEIHLLRHAGIKNYECNICGLKTTTQNELRNHMNSHTKARQVTCPVCSKTYTNPDNLRRHTLIVHQGVKNYQCRFCEEKFSKPDHLKHHEMRHTGERPHKCQICERGFIQLVALKAHMKTHNKIPKNTENKIK